MSRLTQAGGKERRRKQNYREQKGAKINEGDFDFFFPTTNRKGGWG